MTANDICNQEQDVRFFYAYMENEKVSVLSLAIENTVWGVQGR